MFGKGRSRKTKAFLLLLAVLFPAAISFASPGGEGISRGAGRDIEVKAITSHFDGEVVGFIQQAFSAVVANSGTMDIDEDVNVTLSIEYPANETENMTVVHTETVGLGDDLGNVGNETLVTFLPWMPVNQGYHRITIGSDLDDDHPGNDTISIVINVLASHIEGVRVTFAPGSPSNQKVKLGENTNMFGYSPYTFKVHNTGVVNDTYNITIDSEWVMEGWKNTTDELAPGDHELIEVDVAVPIEIDPRSFDVMVFTATSQRNSSVFDSATANTSIPNKEDVEVTVVSRDPVVGYPGGPEERFTFRITNTGDYPTIYTLSVSTSYSGWVGVLNGGPQTRVIPVGSYIDRTATIQLPELRFETMEDDRTTEGETGSLILTATSSSGVADSGVGTVVVGLVHTVQMDLDPKNITIPFTEESKTAPRILNISASVRSINNNKADPGADLNVNLTTPAGPDGVLFKPIWFQGYDDNASRTWTAVPPVGMVKLRSGEWSRGQHIKVIVPPFPFQGTAIVTVEAVPMLIEGRQGLTISASEDIEIQVGEYINYTIDPPETEFYQDAELEMDDDENDNGIEDWREGSPGDVLRLPFNITNTGNGWDRYLLIGDAIPISPSVLLPDDWEMDYEDRTITLIPFNYDPSLTSHSVLAWVQVRIPDGAPIGESATIRIGAASFIKYDRNPDDPDYKWAEVDIHVLQGFGVELEPEESQSSAQPRETIVYRLNVTNIGNGVDLINFLIESPELRGWTVSFGNDRFNMTPGERRTVSIRVTPSEDAIRDEVLALRVRAQSGKHMEAFDEVWINTTVEYVGGVLLELLETPSLIWRYPGETASFLLRVTNTGNGNDTIRAMIDTGNDAWSAYVESLGNQGDSINMDIPLDGSRVFRVNITLPSLDLVRNEEELHEQGIDALNRMDNLLTVYPRGYSSIREEINLTVGVLQEYKVNIYQAPGERASKEVLVGENTDFKLILENRGNGIDSIKAVPSSPEGRIRHLSWVSMDGGPFEADPFSSFFINLTVSPRVQDKPLYQERVFIDVEGVAGDNLTYMSVNLSALISMSRIVTESLDVDLGTVENVIMRICNMPDPGTIPTLELPLQRRYIINSSLPLEDGHGQGWTLPQPELEVTMTNVYQLTEIEVPVAAPGNLIEGSASADMDIRIVGGPDKTEMRSSFLRATYFDAAIDEAMTRFENLYEGKEGKAYLTVITSGNRGQETIPLVVKIQGEVIGSYDAGPANPQDFGSGMAAGGGSQEIVFQFEFDIPELKWYEKGKEMDLEVMIDPEDKIVENTPQGGVVSEDNNLMKSEFKIKNYVPPLGVWILALILLLLMMIAGFIGYFFLKERESWFLLPLSIGAAGAFGMMFYVPLEDAMDLVVANRVGLGIILIDLLFIIPVMVYFFTRAGDAYILHMINRRREDERIEGGETTSTMFKPLTISFAGGLLMVSVPLLFWVIPSEMDGGAAEVMDAILSMDAGIPVIVIIAVVPLIAIGLQLILLLLKKRSLKKIYRTRDDLERLRTEIEEGFQ